MDIFFCCLSRFNYIGHQHSHATQSSLHSDKPQKNKSFLKESEMKVYSRWPTRGYLTSRRESLSKALLTLRWVIKYGFVCGYCNVINPLSLIYIK